MFLPFSSYFTVKPTAKGAVYLVRSARKGEDWRENISFFCSWSWGTENLRVVVTPQRYLENGLQERCLEPHRKVPELKYSHSGSHLGSRSYVPGTVPRALHALSPSILSTVLRSTGTVVTLLTPLRKRNRGKELAQDHTARKKWRHWDQNPDLFDPRDQVHPSRVR